MSISICIKGCIRVWVRDNTGVDIRAAKRFCLIDYIRVIIETSVRKNIRV